MERAEQLLYGANSHATGANIAGTNNNVIQFLNARQRADGMLLAIDRPFLGTQLGGDILAINSSQFVEINQPASPSSTPKGRAKSLRHHAGRNHGREHALRRGAVLFSLSAL